jgi:diaminopimelate decarboxylase
MLPPLQPGDLLAVMHVGAYGAVMGSNYNARPRPPEILVEGDSWRVIRRRETWEDLVRLEE